jgi:hypothetical protein
MGIWDINEEKNQSKEIFYLAFPNAPDDFTAYYEVANLPNHVSK